MSHRSPENEFPLNAVRIDDPFWSPWLELNAREAVLYQWEQLERVGTIDNFRLVAGIKQGFRRGFFYTDSDSHKWAEAAACVIAAGPNRPVEEKLDEYIGIIKKAQTDDGYLFTFNQFHFPGVRWVNLQIEHELYCHGHLIEAGIVHYGATGKNDLLDMAVKAADLIVRDFTGAVPERTPGHQEIEVALLRLYRLTGEMKYMKTAGLFIENRGRTRFFGLKLIRQNARHTARLKEIEKQRAAYPGAEPTPKIDLAMHLGGRKIPLSLHLRSFYQLLSGRYFQQHTPVRKMKNPVGHAVRWTYFMTGAAMFAGLTGDVSLVRSLETSWDRMVRRKTYVTGGIGSLHIVEGFGRDREMDNSWAYCETCAAVGSVLWSAEMLRLTGRPEYADCMERQLYNAVAVGIGLNGRSYHYFNPLESSGGVDRKGWYDTPCCPSNISRLWGKLGSFAWSADRENLWIHQYLGGVTDFSSISNAGSLMKAVVNSSLPWEGKVKIELYFREEETRSLHIRIPSWARRAVITIDGEVDAPLCIDLPNETAGGYSPYGSFYHTITRKWGNHGIVEITFPTGVVVHRAHRRVKNNRGRVALSRGPLVYCMESVDNPGIRVPGGIIDLDRPVSAVYSEKHFGGTWIIRGNDPSGKDLVFIPYSLWANRGPSSMEVWVRTR